MARQRLPLEKARITGADRKNPKRFAGRSEPQTEPLGDPPDWMSTEQRAAWECFRRELPWLMESDRSLVELASTIRARLLMREEVGLNALTVLRQCLSQMGATPVDRTKVKQQEETPFGPIDWGFN